MSKRTENLLSVVKMLAHLDTMIARLSSLGFHHLAWKMEIEKQPWIEKRDRIAGRLSNGN